MCDHCGVGVWRKLVSEYLVVGTSDRLYFGTKCDQTVVGDLIRLYLKVLDNWFTPKHDGYPQCSLVEYQVTPELPQKANEDPPNPPYKGGLNELQQKAIAGPSNIKKITSLPDGFYTLQISNNKSGETEVGKFVKQE